LETETLNRKAKRKVIKTGQKIALAEASPEIPKELSDKWGAVQACSNVHHLLQKGHFEHKYAKLIDVSLEFLGKLHENCIEEALKHPDADLIPELKEVRELKEKVAKDGKKTQ
jgi:hypothetical protein